MTDAASLQRLNALLSPQRPLEIVDIGANPIDGEAPYQKLLGAGLCQVTGFEPQEEARDALNARKSAHETYLPHVVGDGVAKTFNLCRHSGWSGTLKPSAASLDVFATFKDNATIVGSQTLETRRLDDIAEIARVDYLKIDVQGGELDVFRNGRERLAQAVAVQTEVSFVNLYDGQPAFGEVDLELRAQGFIPHHLAAVKRCVISPFRINDDPWLTLNQLMEGDMVYVRDFRHPDRLDDGQLKHMALVAHGCYASYDLAYRCIEQLGARGALAAGASEDYLRLVNAALARR